MEINKLTKVMNSNNMINVIKTGVFFETAEKK